MFNKRPLIALRNAVADPGFAVRGGVNNGKPRSGAANLGGSGGMVPRKIFAKKGCETAHLAQSGGKLYTCSSHFNYPILVPVKQSASLRSLL